MEHMGYDFDKQRLPFYHFQMIIPENKINKQYVNIHHTETYQKHGSVKCVIIDSGNGLVPVQHHATTWTQAD